MRIRNTMSIAVLVAVGLIASTGCVSKGMFRKSIADSESRVDSVESAVEANEKRIGDMRAQTDSKLAAVESKAEKAQELGSSAMSVANTAKSAADEAKRGRLLWNVSLSDERVKFSLGGNQVSSEAKATLDDLIGKIKAYGKAVYVEIEGHTDSTGSEGYNDSLGLARANAVRQYLGQQGGIPLHAMNTISYGESNPVADNSSASGRSKNRRVVVRVLE